MATYNDDNLLIPDDVFKIININIDTKNGLCEPGAPTVTGDDNITQCHSKGFNEAYSRCNRTPGCLGIYHDPKGFQPVSWGGPGCKAPSDDLNLSSRPMPFQLESLPIQPGNGILYVLMDPFNPYSSCSINEMDGFYTNGDNKVLSYVPNRFSNMCYYCQDGSKLIVSGCNTIKCSSGNPAMFNQKNIISDVNKEVNDNLAYRGTDINSHFASNNTQIILDSRLPILDDNGNALFDKSLGNNPVIGTIINGPFVQPGTTVTAIEDTNNNRQIITLSQPLVNVTEKNNQIFIYTFKDSKPPSKKPSSSTKPPNTPTSPNTSTSTSPNISTASDDSTPSDDSTNSNKNSLELSNLFTQQNIIIGSVIIFMIIIIIIILSK